MACPTSYTVVILPLKSSFHALHLFLWVKHMRELEREKDGLWAGLQVLEQAQCWYHTRLQTSARNPALVETRTRRSRLADQDVKGLTSCLQRSCMQRVNGSLGSLMSEPNVSTAPPAPPLTSTDSALRWSLTVLGQEVCEKNQQISSLELERDTLLQQLRSHKAAD
ncbi:suppressor APC domain-containing protein 1 isoform X2 [Hypomesus transpacificus]|uniref:suppressor APC domain-containing protein 1 isoform X2 n=2 Tax=Hypomesus transpacificus TaxID=137520 RepID=UPI001F087DFC|nr:suppressor APC domain-containing protein 1 isoform X2 [Hypomesus transpacificus]